MPQHPGGGDSQCLDQNTNSGSQLLLEEEDSVTNSQGLVMISLDQQERRTGGPNFQVLTDRSHDGGALGQLSDRRSRDEMHQVPRTVAGKVPYNVVEQQR